MKTRVTLTHNIGHLPECVGDGFGKLSKYVIIICCRALPTGYFLKMYIGSMRDTSCTTRIVRTYIDGVLIKGRVFFGTQKNVCKKFISL